MPKKKTFIDNQYHGTKLSKTPHEFSCAYMQSIENLLWTMTERHSKVLVARFDLRYPKDHNTDNSNKDFSNIWLKTFGKTARLEKRKNLQILMLDTFDGLLANKEDNLKAIAALDENLPLIVISHSQLIADTFITDPDRVIHDTDKDKDGKLVNPKLAAAVAPRLEKLSRMNGFILIGHKNVATKAQLGNLVQINLPQLTQFPAGYCYAELYTDGMRIEFRPGLDEFYDECSRLRCAVNGMNIKNRDLYSLTIWNAFYPMDCSKGKK